MDEKGGAQKGRCARGVSGLGIPGDQKALSPRNSCGRAGGWGGGAEQEFGSTESVGDHEDEQG